MQRMEKVVQSEFVVSCTLPSQRVHSLISSNESFVGLVTIIQTIHSLFFSDSFVDSSISHEMLFFFFPFLVNANESERD